MKLRRPGLFALATGLLLALAAVGTAILWSQRGPGLNVEADRLAAAVEMRPGMIVAEIGAGQGRMAARIARRLGPSGRLYATEIEDEKLRAIRSAASGAGLANVTVIRAGEHSANLPDSCCDFVYMRRVYHHLDDTAAINRTLYSAVRPGGRLAIIDFLSPRWMFFLHHGIAPDVLVSQIIAAGFVLERRIDAWSPIDYCLIFRKHAPSAASRVQAFATDIASPDLTFLKTRGSPSIVPNTFTALAARMTPPELAGVRPKNRQKAEPGGQYAMSPAETASSASGPATAFTGIEK